MSQKAPNTRNRLESVKSPKKKKPYVKKGLTVLAEAMKKLEVDKPALTTKIEIKLSKGQLYKNKHGFSKTMKRSMRKHGIDYNPMATMDFLGEYRAIRKARKLKEKRVMQEKHKASVAYKKLHGKKKGAKGQQPKKAAPAKESSK